MKDRFREGVLRMRRSIRLAVCDDEAPVLSYLTDQIRKEFGKYDLCAEADIFISPVELEKVLREKSYDVYFLDIDMPKMNGLELARILREQREEIPLVFVSAREEYVFQSFEVHPFSFVRKSRFKQDMEKAVCDLSRRFCQENQAFCSIRDEAGRCYELPLADTLYLEARDKYVNVFVQRGQDFYVRNTLSNIEKMSEPEQFVRIHKSFVVNLRAVYAIKYEKVILDNGKELPLGRGRSEEVKRRFCRL